MRKYIIIFVVSLFLFLGSANAITKAPVDVTNMSIDELLVAMERGYLTSEVLVNIYLERIEAYDEKFNAINQINEKAIEQAKELDKERKLGKLRGRLHGIPILVKCNIDVYGLPTTAGTKALKDNYPKQNSYVVQKLIDEGAIILGSTNMSELAFSAANSYSSYGYVRNVFNTDYTSYGSSGGSAVAVKAFFAAAALGTDTNSSVRLPAAGAGLVGIRPTLGLVSRSGVIPYDMERDTVGVLSLDVSDSSLLLDIISGEDAKDSITVGVDNYKDDLNKTSLKDVNIGVAMQYVKGSENGSNKVTKLTDNDIYNLTMESIRKLEQAGANIIYLDSFVKSSNLSIATSTYAGGTMCDYFDEYILGTTGTIRSFEELVNSKKYVQSLDGYLSACGKNIKYKSSRDKKKKVYRDYVVDYFEEYDLDVLLYPSLKNKVFKYTKTGNISPGSSLGSVIGFPSLTIPMGFVDEFSYGLEIFSLSYNEKLIYNVANEFEKVNNNKIQTSSLTPSLYFVSENVEELKRIYEKALFINNESSELVDWLKKVEDYFYNYNEISDVDTEARKLCDIYNNLKLSKRTISSNTQLVAKSIVLLMSFISLLIFIKEFSKCFK